MLFPFLSIKSKRRIIALVYHLTIFLISVIGVRIGMVLNNQTLVHLSAFFLVFHLLTFKIIPVSRWIQEKLIPEAVCLSCGEIISLVNRYRCGCGFISYKERHVFSPCPMCGKYFLWVVCPACETSIPI